MSPDLTIAEASPAYLALLGRTRDELVGRYVLDAFPSVPGTPDATGADPLQLSFERARDTGMPDHMPLFRYEVLDQMVHLPLEELCDQLLDRLVDGRPADDVALVAVRHEGARA
jgi:PAS domain-containing protein